MLTASSSITIKGTSIRKKMTREAKPRGKIKTRNELESYAHNPRFKEIQCMDLDETKAGDDLQFAISPSPKVATENKVEGETVLLLKTCDDNRAVLSEESAGLFMPSKLYEGGVLSKKLADEDAKPRGNVKTRNKLESYAYKLRNQLTDKEKLGGNPSNKEIQDTSSDEMKGKLAASKLQGRKVKLFLTASRPRNIFLILPN